MGADLMTLSTEHIATGRNNPNIGTQMVLETNTMRVWHMRLAPGETMPAHRHYHPYFWSVVTDGCAIAEYDDGRTTPISYQAGDTQYFSDLSAENGFVHNLINTGKTELIFVTVEFLTKEA